MNQYVWVALQVTFWMVYVLGAVLTISTCVAVATRDPKTTVGDMMPPMILFVGPLWPAVILGWGFYRLVKALSNFIQTEILSHGG